MGFISYSFKSHFLLCEQVTISTYKDEYVNLTNRFDDTGSQMPSKIGAIEVDRASPIHTTNITDGINFS